MKCTHSSTLSAAMTLCLAVYTSNCGLRSKHTEWSDGLVAFRLIFSFDRRNNNNDLLCRFFLGPFDKLCFGVHHFFVPFFGPTAKL